MPEERTLVSWDEIPKPVLLETIGVLNVIIPGTLERGTGRSEPPLNPAFGWYSDRLFAARTSLLAAYQRQEGRFVESTAIRLEEAVSVSATLEVGFDSTGPLLLRFPIVAIAGSYRQIVWHVPQGLKCWIKLDNPMYRLTLAVGERIGLHEQLLSEAYGPQEPAGAFDIFYLSHDATRRLYSAPEESGAFEIISPASKTYQGDALLPGRYHHSLFVGKVQNGFAELWVERGAAGPGRKLGWIRIRDDGYRTSSDYFPGGSPQLPAIPIDVFFNRTESSSGTRYQRPDEQAIDEQAEPLSEIGEYYLTRIRGRFGLVCELVYQYDGSGGICDQGPCGDSCVFLRPVTWIEVRDRQGRLTVWPVLALSAYGGC